MKSLGFVRIVGIVVLLLISLSINAFAAEEVKLEVWMTSGADKAKELVGSFEASHPGVKVNISPLSWSGYSDKVSLAFATGEAPDILMTGASFVYQVVNENFGIPLNHWTDQWDGLKDFAPGLLKTMSYQGKLYGLPLMAPTRTMWYRKDLFEEHGLDPNNPPETWEQIRNAARKIVRFDGQKVTRIGFSIPSDIIYHAFLTNGVRWFNEDLTQPAVRSPEGIEALTFWSNFSHEMQYVGRELEIKESNIYSGDVGMTYGYVNPATIRATDPALFNDIGGPVVMKHKVKAAYSYPDWLYITSQSKHPDLAWEFMTWITGSDNLAVLSSTIGHPAPRKGAYEHPYYETQEGQLLKREFINATLPYSAPFPLMPDPGAVIALRKDVWNKLQERELSPQAAIEYMEAQLKTIIARTKGE